MKIRLLSVFFSVLLALSFFNLSLAQTATTTDAITTDEELSQQAYQDTKQTEPEIKEATDDSEPKIPETPKTSKIPETPETPKIQKIKKIIGSPTAIPMLFATPVVIDKTGKARDIIKTEFKLRNDGIAKLNLYPSVYNIDPNEGEQAFAQAHNAEDRVGSLANWIEISRGVIELMPGEEKTIPFLIRVNYNAEHGKYHAVISLSQGSTRTQAEADKDKVIITVNVEIKEDIFEKLQLNKFFTDRIYFSGDDVLFSYDLENIGNKDVVPQGEIRIYDRNGEEVTSLNANQNQKMFSPDGKDQIASTWSAVEGFGKYKAFLNLSYGKDQTASIQDTVFFWVVPIKMLGMFVGGALLLVLLFAVFFHRWLEKNGQPVTPSLATLANLPTSNHVLNNTTAQTAPNTDSIKAQNQTQQKIEKEFPVSMARNTLNGSVASKKNAHTAFFSRWKSNKIIKNNNQANQAKTADTQKQNQTANNAKPVLNMRNMNNSTNNNNVTQKNDSAHVGSGTTATNGKVINMRG